MNGAAAPLRVAFAGTPEFARTALEALHHAGHSVALVLTQPDRPAGRGMQLQASAVKAYALAHAMPVAQPRSLRLDGSFPDDAASARQALAQAQVDAIVVAAYGLLLPQWVLESVRLGCINIHASLLPRWRGAAPIHRAIEAGDVRTGVTIMQMDAGLDTGAMLMQQSLAIAASDTTATLHDKLAGLGADLLLQTLRDATAGRLSATAQPSEGISYAHKIDKAEARIDWHSDAEAICRRIRAFNPAPGASTQIGSETIKIWQAYAEQDTARTDTSAPPAGTILEVSDACIRVSSGNGSARGVVCITELQRAGGKRLSAAAFVRGFALQAGQSFASDSGTAAAPR